MSNAFNAIVETNGTSKREIEGTIANPPECDGNVDLRYRMAAVREGIPPNFHDAFTQLHLGQLLALVKCVSRNRRDGGINSNTFYILRDSVSPRPRVDEDLGIDGIAGHG